MIIDMHTHIAAKEDHAEWDHYIQACADSDVSLALVSLVGNFEPWPTADAVRRYNDIGRAFVEYTRPLTRWLAYINPQHANWHAELERCLANGAIGIKLWISLRDEQHGPGHTDAVVARAAELGLPVLIHVYNRTEMRFDERFRGEYDIEDFAALAERHPTAVLIAAHAGGNWRHSLRVLHGRAPNAVVDVSGGYPDRGMTEALVADLGAERVLFGSDALGRSLPSQLAKVMLADLPEDVKRKVLAENAMRIFKLGPLPEHCPRTAKPHVAPPLPSAAEDHFCFTGRWPIHETPCAEPAQLDALLARHGVERAYVGDLTAVYFMDLLAANRAFLSSCAGCRRIAPLATVNPTAQNWRRVLAEVVPGFAGIVAHPFLHNWRLDDPLHAEFFRLCAERRISLWINLRFGDYRFHHSGVVSHEVTPDEVAAFCREAPKNNYVFQGASESHLNAALKSAPPRVRVRFEISRLTDSTPASNRLRAPNGACLVMGSEFPLREIHQVRWTAERL